MNKTEGITARSPASGNIRAVHCTIISLGSKEPWLSASAGSSLYCRNALLMRACAAASVSARTIHTTVHAAGSCRSSSHSRKAPTNPVAPVSTTCLHSVALLPLSALRVLVASADAVKVAAAAAELVGEMGVVEETESVRLADVVKVNGPMPSANFDSLSKSTLTVPF